LRGPLVEWPAGVHFDPLPSKLFSLNRRIGRERIFGQATAMAAEIKATHSGLKVAEQLLLDRRELGRLMRLADLQFGIGRDDAQDLLQETALDIVREKKSIRNPHGYVTRVFYMQCCQFVRRAVRRRAHEGQRSTVAAPAAMPADDLLALEEALGRISPGCRGLLMAHYMEGKGFGEAATEFGFSEKQAWKRFDACLRKLRLTLEGKK